MKLLMHLLPPPAKYSEDLSASEPGKRYTNSLLNFTHAMSCGLWSGLFCFVDVGTIQWETHPFILKDEHERFQMGLAREQQVELVEMWLDVVMWEIRNAFWILCMCGYGLEDGKLGTGENSAPENITWNEEGIKLEDFRDFIPLVERYLHANEKIILYRADGGIMPRIVGIKISGEDCFPGLKFLLELRSESVEARIARHLHEG
ncbi:hypothetical protein BJ508DRAFT_419273 [Ascobolus immersus RN42]|uniref:Uncharacterized protein n=1 Tax=Ascobolus immersus RN42 TaxID=1160509 RepID=A0A3N4HF75_ASCIM|nr:hypothetical protein BJ508DRAFT_419273 [Ascobolus immersus RN42]